MQRQIKSLQQFAQLKGEERRNILRHLSDEEYDHAMKFLGILPYVDFQVKCEGEAIFSLIYNLPKSSLLVMDDENPTEVTAGAIVTVTVTLIRKDMSTLFGDETVAETNTINENGIEMKEGTTGDDQHENQVTVKRPAWLKQRKGGGKKSNKEKKKQKHGGGVKHKAEESPIPPSKAKQEDKMKNNEEDTDDSDISDMEANDERSSDDEAKSSNVQDDDQVLN